MTKPVVLLTTGTRGDLQPYLSLALSLQEAGIPVRLASDPLFSKWAAQYNLPFTPVEGNPSTLMVNSGHQSALTYEGNLLHSLNATFHYLQAARPVFRQMLHSAWMACQGARAVVVGLPTLWGAHIAEALDIPCIFALMQPFSRTTAFQCSLLPVRLPDWSPLNRFSYSLVEQAIWLPWRGVLNQWMRSELHLPPASLTNPASGLYKKDAVVLYAISPSVVSPPADWPATHLLTGFWFLDPTPAWHPSAELEDFLAAGPAPLYFGFGSAGLHRPQAAAEAIRQALQQTSTRAIINLPPEVFPRADDFRQAFFCGDVPHAWLFPRCAGAVHHGGAGTTAEALRAGIPSLVIPLASDQFFWAGRVQSLQAGPVPIPQRSLNGSNLSVGLRQLTGNPLLAENARRLSTAIRSDGGARQASGLVKTYLERK